MMKSTIRSILAGLAGMVLAGAAFAQQLAPVTVNVFREDPGLVIGRLKGLFAAEGLDVRVVRTTNSTDQMRGLSKGDFQIVSTAFDNVLGWSGREGADLIAVAAIGDSQVFSVFVRPEIRTWNDLRGRKVAADAVDTAYALVLRRVLLEQGLDLAKGDYEVLARGNGARRLESMLKGETFAAVLTPPEDQRGTELGLVRMGDSAKVLPDFPNILFAVNRSWAEKERAQLVGFLKAWLAAGRWMRENEVEAARLIEAELKVDPIVVRGYMRDLSRTGALNSSGLERALQLRTGFGLTPPMGPDIAKYFDLQYYQAAARR
jgi:ABC-type nitrate/sulfonate/bicarbonate transport system substrate-binding protein